MLSRLRRPAQVFFLLLAFLFIALLLRSQWDELRSYQWRLHAGWLALSAILIGSSWLFEVGIWRWTLLLMGGRLPFAVATRIWFLSALVRYIPGNVWQPLGMTVLCQRRGIRAEATISSVVLFQAINLLTVAVIAAFYFPLSGNLGLLNQVLPGLNAWMLLGALPAVAFVARPGWLLALLNWTLRRIGRQPLPTQLTSPLLLALMATTLVDWLLFGAGFGALIMAMGDFAVTDLPWLLPHLVGSYTVAYALGYLSFITPSGLAVREGVLYLLLAPILGSGVATAAALAMRVWLTLGELLAAGLSLLIGREKAPLLEPAVLAGGISDG